MNQYMALHLKENTTASNAFLNKKAWDFPSISDQKGFAKRCWVQYFQQWNMPADFCKDFV